LRFQTNCQFKCLEEIMRWFLIQLQLLFIYLMSSVFFYRATKQKTKVILSLFLSLSVCYLLWFYSKLLSNSVSTLNFFFLAFCGITNSLLLFCFCFYLNKHPTQNQTEILSQLFSTINSSRNKFFLIQTLYNTISVALEKPETSIIYFFF